MRTATRRITQEPLAAKVPEIIALFWVIKLFTTAAGEATSDTLGHHVAIGFLVELVLIVVAVWVQFRTRRYFAPAYWFLALAIATTGTGAADTMHVFGIPYVGTTIFWAAVLAYIFRRWYRTEGTLSIHSITTHRREKYYWATVFATFALGTALGDFTASTPGLGYFSSPCCSSWPSCWPRSPGVSASPPSPRSGGRTCCPGRWGHQPPIASASRARPAASAWATASPR